MKTIYGVLAIFLFSFCNSANAQYVTIPDSAFRSQLILKFPGCFNSVGQMDTSCVSILNNTVLKICVLCGNTALDATNIKNLEGLKYFKNLSEVYIWDNLLLTRLPKLPSSLKYINITKCENLDSLPNLPDSLNALYILAKTKKGLFTYLPPLPTTLTFLFVSNCQLSFLPTLPNSLTYLSCHFNYISALPTLPNGLANLVCAANQITSLPRLPDSLRTLYLNLNSGLTSLPNLPYSLKELYITGTNITCLPVLPSKLEKLSMDTANIRCIPNTNNNLLIYGSNNNITHSELCNISNNINGCNAYPVIAGTTFYDINSNNIKEQNEPYKANNKIQLSNGAITFTNDSGYYEIGTTTLGQYTVTPSNTFFNVTPPSQTFNFIRYDSMAFQNFAYQANSAIDSIQVNITAYSMIARPGNMFLYKIFGQNVGTTNLNATTIKVVYDNTKLTFDSASNASVINSGNIITLNLSTFALGSNIPFLIYFTIKPNITNTDSIKVIANMNSGILSSSDSAINYVVTSFDPNDKTATPRLSPSQVANGKYIDYTIRYQNTGNDTAFHVVVTDTLSSKLQTNTLEMVSTSHNTKTTIIGNAVSFEMRNILLPDSNANEVKSHGFIRFRIKPKATLVLGDSVKNKAAIYFDYNSPVITNTAITQIKNESTLPLKLISFKGYKNSDGNIHLYWTTANEINTKQFAVEQSSNSREFAAIGNVKAKGYGNNSYSFDVANPAKVDLFFRLKMIDKDGAFTYSPVILIKDKINNAGFVLQENPVQHKLVLSSIAAALLNTEAVLTNSVGAVVKRFVIRSTTQTVDVNDLPSGVFYLKTLQGNEEVVISR